MRPTGRTLAWAALCALPALMIGTVASADRGDVTFPVASGGRLEVDLQTGGSIEIRGWDRDEVQVEAEFHGQDQDNIEFDADEEGGQVVVRTEYRERRRRNNAGVRLEIRVPLRFDLSLSTGGGEIQIDDVEGAIEGETGGGNLELTGLRGTVELRTGGGNVRVTDSDVDGGVKTGGGNVVIRDVNGLLEASSQGGNVIFDNVHPAASSPCREVKISTMGGNIRSPEAMCGADLETMGGNIEVERATEYVEATTMGGNITIDEVDGWVRASTHGGNISVVMVGNEGRRDVRLISQGGDVTLTLPDGLSMEFDFALAYTKNSRRDYRILSDFPMVIRQSDSWSYDGDRPKMHFYGSGTVDGGRHKIKVETTNGDIRLIRGTR